MKVVITLVKICMTVVKFLRELSFDIIASIIYDN